MHEGDDEMMVRNSLAPNDGYENNKMPEHLEVILQNCKLVFINFIKLIINIIKIKDGRRRSSHRITNEHYGHFASVMLRKKQNPAPNMTDRFFCHVWKKIGYYIPLAAVLSVFDWGSDLFGTIEFMGHEVTHLIM